jgi:hypothetical protein
MAENTQIPDQNINQNPQEFNQHPQSFAPLDQNVNGVPDLIELQRQQQVYYEQPSPQQMQQPMNMQPIQQNLQPQQMPVDQTQVYQQNVQYQQPMPINNGYGQQPVFQTPPLKSPKKTDKTRIVLIALAGIILVGLIAGLAVWILRDTIFPKQTQLAQSSSSLESSSSQRSAFYFPRFFNPIDKPTNSNTANNSSNGVASSQARSLPAIVKLDTQPAKTGTGEKKSYPSLTCSDGTNTTHGIVEIKMNEVPNASMLIMNKSMIIDAADNANYERANNWLSKNTEFQADTTVTYGPDYLQSLRKDCTSSIIQKIKSYDSVALTNSSNNRVQSDIRGSNADLFIAVNIYGKKDDNIFVVTKSYPFGEVLTREQKEKCTVNNAPVRTCIKDTITQSTEIAKKLETDLKELVDKYSF